MVRRGSLRRRPAFFGGFVSAAAVPRAQLPQAVCDVAALDETHRRHIVPRSASSVSSTSRTRERATSGPSERARSYHIRAAWK